MYKFSLCEKPHQFPTNFMTVKIVSHDITYKTTNTTLQTC